MIALFVFVLCIVSAVIGVAVGVGVTIRHYSGYEDLSYKKGYTKAICDLKKYHWYWNYETDMYVAADLVKTEVDGEDSRNS